MSWSGKRIIGSAFWAGEVDDGYQSLSISNLPTGVPSFNDISNNLISTPTLTLSPQGNTVTLPIPYWSYYAASNHIWVIDTTSGNLGDIENIGGDLYWNSNLIGLASNIPDIGDWAFYPALSNIEVDNRDILDVSGLFVSTIYSRNISGINGLFSNLNISSITAGPIRASSITTRSADISNCFVSTLTARNISSFTSQTSTLTTNTVRLGSGLLSQGILDTLLWNGVTVATASNEAGLANWSKYPILTGSNVAASGNNQTRIGNGNGSVLLQGGGLTATTDFGQFFSNDRGIDILAPATISIYTENGQFGKIALTADSGDDIQGNLNQGGLIELIANSALAGLTPAALSRINQEAATVTVSAGALGSLAFVPGSVNLLSGLGTGIQLLTATGVINVASGQALTLSAAQAVVLNGGANGVQCTNTSGSKLQSDTLLPYQSNYTFISSFTNEYGYSKQLEASTMTVFSELDVPNEAYIRDATITVIRGTGPDLPIINAGGVRLIHGAGQNVRVLEGSSPATTTPGNFRAGAIFGGSIDISGNIRSSNAAVIAPFGSFSNLQTNQLSTSTWRGTGGGYISSLTGNNWLILDNVSTQSLYSQLKLETDGGVIGNTIQGSSVSTSTATMTSGSISSATISSINGFQYRGPVYAAFSSSNTQIVTAANTPTVIIYNTLEVAAGGISYSGSQITVPTTGDYSILTSIQFDKSGGGIDFCDFWIRVNGTNVPRSASQIAVAGTQGEVLGTIEIIVSMTAGQYFEVVIASGDNTMSAAAFPAITTPFIRPAIPSIITTVKRLSP